MYFSLFIIQKIFATYTILFVVNVQFLITCVQIFMNAVQSDTVSYKCITKNFLKFYLQVKNTDFVPKRLKRTLILYLFGN